MKFLDEAKISIRSGSGGGGCVSFHRARFIPKGGPDGGDGGKGGDVIALCAAGLNTLADYRYRRHFRAGNGLGGSGRHRTGRSGGDIILKLPAGTQIYQPTCQLGQPNKLLADLTEVGARYTIARGGEGGLGNARFKSSVRQAPRLAQKGGDGVDMDILLRLKIIADAGLIGLPNAGKSALLAALSASRPKIASYPFTTLTPNLGAVDLTLGEFVTLADIPGVIEGAHCGAGLGVRFLKHIERCPLLLHLVDASLADAAAAWLLVRRELAAYSPALAGKKEIVILAKSDLARGQLDAQKQALTQAGCGTILALSSQTGEGLDALKDRLAQIISPAAGRAVPAAGRMAL